MEVMMLFWTAAAVVVAWLALLGSLTMIPANNAQEQQKKANVKRWFWRGTWGLTAVFTIIACIVVAIAVKKRIRKTDEDEVKRVVKESQTYELTIYHNPKGFDNGQLHRYWVPADQGGKTAEDIENAVGRLVKKGWYYGKESTAEGFEYQSVAINGDQAVVRTQERWYCPVYREKDKSPVKERNPKQAWEATYTLRKINDKWLIQETTLPYKRGGESTR